MFIPLDHDSPTTLPRQISTYLEELIRHGHLGPAARLPATRKLAQTLGVSKNTVEAAYDELKARKLVNVRPGRAAVVRRNIPETTEQHLPFREPRGRDPLPARAWLRATEAGDGVYDLAGIGGRLPNLSSSQLRSFHRDALTMGRGPLFSSPPPLGESALRAAASRHLARCGVLRSADDVAVLPSRADAMAKILRMFVPPRGLVLADSLLDPDLVLPLRTRRARIVVLPAEESRLLAAGRRAPRLLVVATGASRLPGRPPGLTRRRALLDLAKRKGIPVVEDVTHTDWLSGPPVPPPLTVLDPAGRVLPMCDLSDEAGAGFAACVVGGTSKALDRFRVDAKSSAKPLDRLAQRALAAALDAPSRVREQRRIREQRQLLEAAIGRSLNRRLPALAGHEFSAGSDAVRLDLPAGVSGASLQEAAQEHGVLVRSGRDCGATPAADRFVLLDLTRHEEGELLEGIRRLGQALDGSLALHRT
jgi:GntR family transcriptional regulator/MocR family aminotransferase